MCITLSFSAVGLSVTFKRAVCAGNKVCGRLKFTNRQGLGQSYWKHFWFMILQSITFYK